MQDLDLYQPVADDGLQVNAVTFVSQSFVAKHPNLTSVRLLSSNNNFQGNSSYEITLSDERENVLRNLLLTDANLGWNAELRFDFAPIPDSYNKKFVVKLVQLKAGQSESPNTNPTKISKDSTILSEALTKNSLLITSSRKDVYSEGQAYTNNTATTGDLVFRTYYKTDVIALLRNSTTIVIQKLRLDPIFSLFYGLLLISLLLILIWPRYKKKI